MKKFTNYAPGARGITLKPKDKDGAHEIVWLEPGETASVDPARIVEPLPDLGTKADPADTAEDDQVAALTAERDALKAQVEAQVKELTSLRADLEKATKPK